ncbi:MAG: heme ABC transporter permease [Rickettsiales bacterium]|nr:heme ABC transporter permease [Rickettsiales bacterium]
MTESNWQQLANPKVFSDISEKITPLMLILMVILLGAGLYFAMIESPPDYQQGEMVRIMYIHVPAAWLSMLIYGIMALASGSYLIWKHPLADLVARNAAPIGCAFTLITLVTGSLWGKPMWGAWWVWDARLTSVLILFFLYLGYIGITQVDIIDEGNRKIAAIMSVFGAVNLPIIKFSVEWWNTLHQPASVFRLDGPTIDGSMMTPLMLMFFGLFCFTIYCVLMRVQGSLFKQKWRRMQLQSMAR